MTTDDERVDDEQVDPAHTDEQDFALRNVTMSNALPGGGQPAAGAVVESEGRLGMQPETDEEILDETETAAGDAEDPAAARS